MASQTTPTKGQTEKAAWLAKKKNYAPVVKKQPGEVPMLYLHKGSQFHVFMDAISKSGLEQFGHAAKMFETNIKYDPPMPSRADYAWLTDPDEQKVAWLEAIKAYTKEKIHIDTQAPKMYGFIWKYLSVGSVEEIKQHKDYKTFSVDKDPVARERFDAAHKSQEDAGNAAISAADQAMDFFKGLDPVRYSEFRTTINNQMELNPLITLPTVNRVYDLAGKWVKAVPVHGRQGNATTYVTTNLDYVPPTPTPPAEKPQPEPEKTTDVLATTDATRASNTKTGKRDLKDVECFKCGLYGHYAHKCPNKKKPSEEALDADDEIHTLNATWEAATFCTHQVNSAVDNSLKVQPNEVLIDNAADISIIKPHLLENLRNSEKEIKINGVGGLTLTVDKVGDLPNFFQVYSSEKTLANVLSFSDVEDKYPITYVPGESFIVHLPDRDIEFKKRGKLFVALWEEVVGILTTVQEAESFYSKAEVKRAKEAHALIRNSGYPSMNELIRLIEDGNILELPSISRADIKRAYDIYGLPVEYVRGKMTKKTAGRQRIEPALQGSEKDQVLYSDVMHIDETHYLITVCDPLNLTLQTPVDRETADVLGLALQGHLQVLRERAFTPKIVHVDPASAFTALRTQFPGVIIDVGGARDFVAKVDAKIRRIKDTYRSVKAGLPYPLAKARAKDLVAYCVSRMNTRGTTALSGNLSPRVLFTGIKPNFKKEFSLAFGDYVEVYNGTTNTSQERSVGAIALYPVGNSTGSWQFWCLESRSYVRRSTWTKMVTSDVVSGAMNNFALHDPIPRSPSTSADFPVGAVAALPAPVSVADVQPDSTPIADDDDGEMPDMFNPDDYDSDFEDESTGQPAPTRRSARIAEGVKPPEKLTLATNILATKVREDKNEGTVNAVNAELSQLFTEMEALAPVKEIPKNAEVLNGILIVVEKFLANGDHDKWKGRLVADGRSQDRALYPNKSSPTLSIHSLFTVLAFYAGLTGYLMSKVDIKGAFVQTPMTGPPIFLRLNKKIAGHATRLYPEYMDFLQPDGSLLNQILKAMYGCVQASSLWFTLLTKLLFSQGYVASETDRCVLRRASGGLIFCILIYVDDLLIFASSAETERIRRFLTKAFTTITMSIDNSLSYLGMQLLWKDRTFTVDMDFYVRQTLKDWMHLPIRNTPGTKDLFKINDTSPLLAERSRQIFHSTIARILYLAKRVRGDIITVVSFLCTRVTKATEEDQAKLESLLGYLKRTMTQKLYLHAFTSRQLLAFIDAAFALHFFDSKSHTGVIITMGGVVIYISSRKQKCIAKSPTEAELVGLTDNLGLVELFHEFLSFLFGEPIPLPIIYQDSTSVISLVTRGGGVTRTKHMRARVNLGKECFDEKRALIQYCHTKMMRADGASKVLEGSPFTQFARFVQGHPMAWTTGGR